MSKRKKDKEKIIAEWKWIYENYNRFDSIIDVKQPPVSAAFVGHNIGHLKPSNYLEIYNNVIEDEQYSIYLSDESLICFHYVFDSTGKMVGHNLMYIPNPIDESGKNSEEVAYSKFLRADFDQKGYQNVIHTQVHLHISVYKTEFRLPMAHCLSPKEFLYIILKYMYHMEEPFVDKLLTENEHSILLNDDELNKLRVLFGK